MIESVTFYNKELQKELTFSMADDQKIFFLDSIDFGVVNAEFSTFQTRGTDYNQYNDMRIPEREINFIGYVASWDDTDIPVNRKTVNDFFDPTHEMTIRIDETYGIDAYPESSIKFEEVYAVNNENIFRLEVRLFAYNPLFYELEETVISNTYTGSGATATFSTVIGFTGSDVPITYDIQINHTNGSFQNLNVYTRTYDGSTTRDGIGQLTCTGGTDFSFGGTETIHIRNELGAMDAYVPMPSGRISLILYATYFKRFVAMSTERTTLYVQFTGGTAGQSSAAEIIIRYTKYFLEIRTT